MIEWFTAPGSGPFTVALLVMLGLALVELLAMMTGFSLGDAFDEFVVSNSGIGSLNEGATGLEATGVEVQGLAGRLLAWLYVGRVPVLMILILFLTVFGLSGLIVQGVLRSVFGLALPGVLAAPAVLLGCLPLVRACTAGLARVMPRDESSAVDPATFVGRVATVTGGAARADMPAQARLTDSFGTTHYVLVEPEDQEVVLDPGSVVLLVRQTSGGRFAAIANPSASLLDEAGGP